MSYIRDTFYKRNYSTYHLLHLTNTAHGDNAIIIKNNTNDFKEEKYVARNYNCNY